MVWVAINGIQQLKSRVVAASEAALAEDKSVTVIEVLLGLGWLAQPRLIEWRQGRLPYLEGGMSVNPNKLSTVLRVFDTWAKEQGLEPSEQEYVSQTRDRHPLRFSKSGEEGIERIYRMRWLSPELPEQKRQKLIERRSKPPDLVVISPLHDWTCARCTGTGTFLIMEQNAPLCLACAGLNHLVYLPAGDSTLTRRAKQASGLSAVVVRFSRSRKRYERQGILVEEAALNQAEK